MERPDLSAGDAVTFRQTLTADDLDISARLAADTNRVPIEEDVATGTRFQGRLVHSTVLSGPINATIARLPGLPIILRQKLEFLAPAQPGCLPSFEIGMKHRQPSRPTGHASSFGGSVRRGDPCRGRP